MLDNKRLSDHSHLFPVKEIVLIEANFFATCPNFIDLFPCLLLNCSKLCLKISHCVGNIKNLVRSSKNPLPQKFIHIIDSSFLCEIVKHNAE